MPPRGHPTTSGNISGSRIGGGEGLLLAPSGYKPGAHRAPTTQSPGPQGTVPRPRAWPCGRSSRKERRQRRRCLRAVLLRRLEPSPVCLTDLRKGKQPIVGPDGSAPAGAINPHRQRVLPFAVDGGRWKPARHISLQRVLAVLAARFSPRAVPESEHL